MENPKMEAKMDAMQVTIDKLMQSANKEVREDAADKIMKVISADSPTSGPESSKEYQGAFKCRLRVYYDQLTN